MCGGEVSEPGRRQRAGHGGRRRRDPVRSQHARARGAQARQADTRVAAVFLRAGPVANRTSENITDDGAQNIRMLDILTTRFRIYI